MYTYTHTYTYTYTGVHALLLSGGGARMPKVQAALTALCPQAAVHFAGAAEESVSRGAAYAGALLRPLSLNDTPGERQGALETRARLPRALAIATAEGGQLTLAEALAAVPLTRTARFAAPESGAPLLLRLVELPLPAATGADGEDGARSEPASTAPAASSQMRTVATLALRDVPSGLGALVLRLSVDSEKRVELTCEGEPSLPAATDSEGGDEPPQPPPAIALGVVRA